MARMRASGSASNTAHRALPLFLLLVLPVLQGLSKVHGEGLRASVFQENSESIQDGHSTVWQKA